MPAQIPYDSHKHNSEYKRFDIFIWKEFGMGPTLFCTDQKETAIFWSKIGFSVYDRLTQTSLKQEKFQ